MLYWISSLLEISIVPKITGLLSLSEVPSRMLAKGKLKD